MVYPHLSEFPLEGRVVAATVLGKVETVHPNFTELFLLVREIGHGEISIKIENGIPVLAEQVKQKIKFGGAQWIVRNSNVF